MLITCGLIVHLTPCSRNPTRSRRNNVSASRPLGKMQCTRWTGQSSATKTSAAYDTHDGASTVCDLSYIFYSVLRSMSAEIPTPIWPEGDGKTVNGRERSALLRGSCGGQRISASEGRILRKPESAPDDYPWLKEVPSGPSTRSVTRQQKEARSRRREEKGLTQIEGSRTDHGRRGPC